jgi:transcriptional regulator with XRE-family HTH domain
MEPAVIDADGGFLTPRALTRQEFGRRLFKLLNERGMNQSDLARQADMGRDSISTYVNGHTFPTPKNLRAMAEALGVEPHELLPNEIMSAFDDEHPAIELKQAAGHPGKAWLRVNRMMSFGTAARIVTLIEEDDSK